MAQALPLTLPVRHHRQNPRKSHVINADEFYGMIDMIHKIRNIRNNVFGGSPVAVDPATMGNMKAKYKDKEDE